MGLHEFREMLEPARLWPAAAVAARPALAPDRAGLYAWYFRELPPGVPAQGCVVRDGLTLLYVGIAPSRPTSRTTLRSRLQKHLCKDASQSTLRFSLGCLLREALDLRLRPTPGRRLTFGEGEARLSAWLAAQAALVWMLHPAPWEPEPRLIQSVSLPLNLQDNQGHPFRATLSALRRAAKRRAADGKRKSE